MWTTLHLDPTSLAEARLVVHWASQLVAAAGASLLDARSELGRWIANAHDILERFVRDDPYASEVRLWPHHFDIASLVTVVPNRDPERAKSVNVGFSFGDETYGEPYAYVSPWPYPTSRSEAPPLTYGGWHTEGFFAAVFRGSDLLAGGGEGQAQRVERFLAQASDLSRTMLGVPLGPR